jgi:hypothetical protein
MSSNNDDIDFKINPCKACKIKCPNPADVNCINNCCYETLGAFDGAWSLNQVRNTEDAKNCFDCVSESINCMGRDRCDLRITASPFFNQAPHYFPEVFNETKNVEKAKKICYDYCLDCKYTKTCMENCDTDSSAIETFSKKKSVTKDSPPKQQKRSYRDTNPFSFYTGFIVGTILFTFILILFIKTLLYGNNF